MCSTTLWWYIFIFKIHKISPIGYGTENWLRTYTQKCYKVYFHKMSILCLVFIKKLFKYSLTMPKSSRIPELIRSVCRWTNRQTTNERIEQKKPAGKNVLPVDLLYVDAPLLIDISHFLDWAKSALDIVAWFILEKSSISLSSKNRMCSKNSTFF